MTDEQMAEELQALVQQAMDTHQRLLKMRDGLGGKDYRELLIDSLDVALSIDHCCWEMERDLGRSKALREASETIREMVGATEPSDAN